MAKAESYFKVSPEIPTEITDGRKVISTAGVRETLVAVSTPAKGCYITVVSTSTGVVEVGGATVVAATGSQQGTPMYGGDTLPFYIDDLKKIYLDVTISGDSVTFTKFV